jgi:hypothetical protein
LRCLIEPSNVKIGYSFDVSVGGIEEIKRIKRREKTKAATSPYCGGETTYAIAMIFVP